MPPRSALPGPVRVLLRIIARLVPRAYRDDWLREWQGELYHHRTRRAASSLDLVGRCLGSLPDAFWIRTHDWSPDMLLQDLRFALRAHLRRPAFAVVAVLVLALGIGATTALFSIVNGVLLEPLPYPDADRLVRLYGYNESRGVSRVNMNPLDLMDVREQVAAIDGLAYETQSSVTLTSSSEPLRLRAAYVAAEFFEVLGAQPVQGRWFATEEDSAGVGRTVVLAHHTWQQVLGGADVVGTDVLLSGDPHTVIGIAPAGFQGPFNAEPEDLWVTWPYDPQTTNRGGHFMRAVARLSPGVSLQAAQQEVNAVYATIAEEFDKPGRGLELVPLHESVVGETRPVLVTLLAAVVAVLAIVCANLAGLLLARASGRRQELGVRMALGAARVRIVRQLLTESIVLSLAGGLVGVLLAVVGTRTVGRALAALVATRPDVGLDLRVLAFALAVSAGTGLLFGLAPALRATRRDVRESIQDAARGAGPDRTTLRAGLVIAEVALSLVLLLGAGMLLRSFANLLAVETGYDPRGVLTARLSVPESDYPDSAGVVAFYDALTSRVAALPGVRETGVVNRLPLGGSYSCDGFHLEGWPAPEPGQFECAEERVVGGEYFQAMGIELLRGRGFDDTDGADSAEVVVISRTMAERYFPDRDPLGAGFKWGGADERPFRRVIGIVEDVKHIGLDADPMPEVYMPMAQYPFYRTLYLSVRAGDDPQALVGPVREALRQLDSSLPLFDVASMQERLRDSVAVRRLMLLTLGSFAVVALVLACIGLYGVLAYAVSQRTREIGIRMALGARGGDVTGLVLRRGLSLAVVGVGLGGVGWWLLSGSLEGLLYRVRPGDPLTLVATAALLLLLAALASYLPARRATRVDPVRALRS